MVTSIRNSNCGCQEWVIFPQEALLKSVPKDTSALIKIHECEKLAVFRIQKRLKRIFVFKQLKEEPKKDVPAEPSPVAGDTKQEPVPPPDGGENKPDVV